MVFKRKQGGGHKPPDLSVALSVKQGNGYIKGPSFGLWSNEEGGPAFRGSLKGEYLAQVLEFLTNAYDADIPVGLAVFENDNQGPAKQGFKKPAAGGFKKKPNPFKKQTEPEPEEEQEEEEGPTF